MWLQQEDSAGSEWSFRLYVPSFRKTDTTSWSESPRVALGRLFCFYPLKGKNPTLSSLLLVDQVSFTGKLPVSLFLYKHEGVNPLTFR
jgi:hypothetical protein